MTDAQAYFLGLENCSCSDSEVQAFASRIVKDHYFVESENDGDDGYAVVELDDHKFAVLAECQDYTGHGCRCAQWASGPFDSLDEAIRMGLESSGRRILGCQIPELDGVK